MKRMLVVVLFLVGCGMGSEGPPSQSSISSATTETYRLPNGDHILTVDVVYNFALVPSCGEKKESCILRFEFYGIQRQDRHILIPSPDWREQHRLPRQYVLVDVRNPEEPFRLESVRRDGNGVETRVVEWEGTIRVSHPSEKNPVRGKV